MERGMNRFGDDVIRPILKYYTNQIIHLLGGSSLIYGLDKTPRGSEIEDWQAGSRLKIG
ncbi:hypothetical protein WN48_07814 [Eufriesea mexicana]|uniref:Uncharacterized protein n=1 Tax=Eufriesea mexicana TaxID=516756 RepID=A0A310S8C7_9HYME|nr:hypothetical protein WN48_07814 [Eufriesea mexicana]